MSTKTATDADARDPNFPNQPFVSDEWFAGWTEKRKLARHVLEIAEAAKVFDARQAAGVSIFDARGGGLAGAADEPERVAAGAPSIALSEKPRPMRSPRRPAAGNFKEGATIWVTKFATSPLKLSRTVFLLVIERPRSTAAIYWPA